MFARTESDAFGPGEEKSEPKSTYQIKIMYMRGTTDGYTHHYGGPLYRTFAAAEAAGEREDGHYSVEPKAVQTIELSDGRVYTIEGPHKTADTLEIELTLRKAAWNRLTPMERELLGLKEEPK